MSVDPHVIPLHSPPGSTSSPVSRPSSTSPVLPSQELIHSHQSDVSSIFHPLTNPLLPRHLVYLYLYLPPTSHQNHQTHHQPKQCPSTASSSSPPPLPPPPHHPQCGTASPPPRPAPRSSSSPPVPPPPPPPPPPRHPQTKCGPALQQTTPSSPPQNAAGPSPRCGRAGRTTPPRRPLVLAVPLRQQRPR
ncbi:hypothetical protein GE09DRAFT_144184 [Coniochaeta sp. 2T2.1]|nr:hypothetical protein GE09DRAFT_144184 [Coniochaeta sp. 2T2.1]